jgi:2-polyprenyl-3-methyl-5-hydroxy-6-metoxy-1,4-benzoquinol methylase
MRNKKEKLYNDFHKNTDPQKKIINKHNFTYHIIINMLDKYLTKPRMKILDIGCGAGTIDFYLAKQGHLLYGIDISDIAINSCKETAKELNISNIKFNVLDFPRTIPNEKFDAVVCFEVIEHLKNDQLALKKINDLLKPGGLLILSTPSSNAPLHKLGYSDSFDKRVGHLRRYKIDDLVRMFESNGFSIIETNKTEGLFRNFLFLNPIAGKLVRFLKYPIYLVFNIFDQISLTLFGESDIFIIAKNNS